MSLTFCINCGNPRNPGEKICRFCGNVFEEPKYILSHNNDDILNDNENPDNNSPVEIINDANMVAVDDDENILQNDSHDEYSDIDCCIKAELTELPDDNSLKDNSNVDFNTYNIDDSSDSPNSQDFQTQKNTSDKYYNISKKRFWVIGSILLAIIISIIAVFLYLYLQKDTPSDVVNKAFNCLKENKYDEFCNYLDLSKKSKRLMNELCPKVMKLYGDDIDHIEIVSENTNEDNTSEVIVSLLFKDGTTKQSEVSLVKIKDEWKIKPFGDFDFGLDSLMGIGNLFGFDDDTTFKDNIIDIIGNIF